MTTCKGCGAPINFIRTINGRLMPVDPEVIHWNGPERYDGTLITINGETRRNPQAPVSGYTPHFVTCPQSNTFHRLLSTPAGPRGKLVIHKRERQP